MGCCKFRRLNDKQEKRAMSKTFVWLIIIQSIVVIILCLLSINYFNSINISKYISVDIVTMFNAVIILSLILVVVGWASARSNTTFAWFFFHLFMVVLLVVEIIMSWFTTDMNTVIESAAILWKSQEEDERIELQMDLNCCGFDDFVNVTIGNNYGCPQNAKTSCKEELMSILMNLRNTACVSMFVCFVLGIFIDFAGCAICYHPDVISIADHELEMTEIAAQQMEMETFTNPFGQ